MLNARQKHDIRALLIQYASDKMQTQRDGRVASSRNDTDGFNKAMTESLDATNRCLDAIERALEQTITDDWRKTI